MQDGPLAYTELDAALRNLGFHMGAAEYHGALCGMLCVQKNPPGDLGLETDPPADAAVATQAEGLLQALRSQCLESLCDPESGFMLMLPEDGQLLDRRVEALAEWCQGFLFGLAGGTQLDLNNVSSELREVVNDFIQISRAGVEDASDPDPEADENAYTELVEYVRTGAQLAFLELRPGVEGQHSTGTLH